MHGIETLVGMINIPMDQLVSTSDNRSEMFLELPLVCSNMKLADCHVKIVFKQK